MANNNVVSFRKRTRQRRHLNYKQILERWALPIGLTVAVAGPAVLLALPTGGLLPLLLLIANDVFGGALGAFLFLFYPRTRSSVLSLQPIEPNADTSPLEKAA